MGIEEGKVPEKGRTAVLCVEDGSPGSVDKRKRGEPFIPQTQVYFTNMDLPQFECWDEWVSEQDCRIE